MHWGVSCTFFRGGMVTQGGWHPAFFGGRMSEAWGGLNFWGGVSRTFFRGSLHTRTYGPAPDNGRSTHPSWQCILVGGYARSEMSSHLWCIYSKHILDTHYRTHSPPSGTWHAADVSELCTGPGGWPARTQTHTHHTLTSIQHLTAAEVA